MKTIKKIGILFIITAFLFSSCKKMMEDINQDPDNPNDVPVNVRLAAIETILAYTYGGDASRLSSIYTQHIQGDARQWTVLQNYGIIGEDVNEMWADNLYADVLMEIKFLKEKSAEDNLEHYIGIAKALEAYTLMYMTDFWGAIPYTEAFQGVDNLQPGYDEQQAIYNSINTLLSQASAHLGASNGGIFLPGTDDLIYAGDIPKWQGFVSLLKARSLLHLVLKNGGNYASALTEITTNLGLVADAKVNFGGTNASPMYQFNIQRGDVSISDSMASLLASLNDPRDTNLYNNPFDDNHPLLTDDYPVTLLSVTEQLFIVAECTFQTAGAVAAHPIYLSAIQSSLNGYGMGASYAGYVGQASVDPGAASLTLNHIMTQKYIALFMSPEVFNDMRRTGLPVITPNTGTQVPNRFPYPQQEVTLNASTPSGLSIFSKIWWQN